MTAATTTEQAWNGGYVLRDLRTLAGLSLTRTAEIAHVSRNDLAHAERGEWKPSQGWIDNVIHALADEIGVPSFARVDPERLAIPEARAAR